MRDDDAKMLYNLAKVTNVTKTIMDDFNSSVTMFLFKMYIDNMGGKEFLEMFLDDWETNLLNQKAAELDILSNPEDSTLQDMVLGAKLANSESLEEYANEVKVVKEILFESLS